MDDADFLRAIAADPGDATLRLAYADWLDERADPRGEYLRLQHQLAQAADRLEQLRWRLDPGWADAVRPPLRPEWVTLRTGRTIRLTRLRQWHVYGGLLEGYPTRTLNQQRIDQAVATGREGGWATHLLPPPERVVDPDTIPGLHRFYAERGGAAFLPAVACVGQFESKGRATSDPDADGSALTIVWFQEAFAMPIGPAALGQMREIDWDRVAEDTFL